MVARTTLKTIVLLGLAHLGTPQRPLHQSCNIDSYFTVEIDIQPNTKGGGNKFNATACASHKAKTKLRELIQQQVDKRFDAYFTATRSLHAVEVEHFCGGGNSSSREEAKNNRVLALDFSKAGWYYSSTAKCRFCLPDDQDSSQGMMHNTSMFNNNDVGEGFDPHADSRRRAEQDLQRALEGNLRRILTRKVNKNKRRSCLVGSKSRLNITLTPTNSQPPSIVCPPVD